MKPCRRWRGGAGGSRKAPGGSCGAWGRELRGRGLGPSAGGGARLDAEDAVLSEALEDVLGLRLQAEQVEHHLEARTGHVREKGLRVFVESQAGARARASEPATDKALWRVWKAALERVCSGELGGTPEGQRSEERA